MKIHQMSDAAIKAKLALLAKPEPVVEKDKSYPQGPQTNSLYAQHLVSETAARWKRKNP